MASSAAPNSRSAVMGRSVSATAQAAAAGERGDGLGGDELAHGVQDALAAGARHLEIAGGIAGAVGARAEHELGRHAALVAYRQRPLAIIKAIQTWRGALGGRSVSEG